MRPSDLFNVPFDKWVSTFVADDLVPVMRPIAQTVRIPVAWVLNTFELALLSLPFAAVFIALVAFAYFVSGRRIAIFMAISLVLFDVLGIWNETMMTLSMVVTSVFFCLLIGLPLGILASISNRFSATLRPILDVMQTAPAFVYLVPVVMLFGIGKVPGMVATIIFALPPVVRLTELGIRQVSEELIEAGTAFGANRSQILREISIPMALPTIMAGINQTLMLSLSMVVITAMIGGTGLGMIVFTGIGRLDIGKAALGGLGIVLLAILLDRLTQSVSSAKSRSKED